MTSSESPHSFDETEGPFHPAHRHCRRRAGGGGRRQGGQGRHQECQGPGGESEAHADRPWARGSPQRRPCSSTPATCTRHPPASWVGYTAGPPPSSSRPSSPSVNRRPRRMSGPQESRDEPPRSPGGGSRRQTRLRGPRQQLRPQPVAHLRPTAGARARAGPTDV